MAYLFVNRASTVPVVRRNLDIFENLRLLLSGFVS